MSKIQGLLEKAGVSEELAGQIVESLEKYKAEVRKTFEEEYATKVEQAKKVCIEETETHKRELARRLQIFCETKAAAIESQVAKQSALSESEAVSKLTTLKATLEGIQLNGAPNGKATAGLEKAKKQLKIAVEAKDRAIEKANRQTALAEQALKNNRKLTSENAKLKKRVAGPVSESKGQKSRRIDGSRRKAKPATTRPTIVENQTRQPAPKNQQPVTGTGTGNGFGIDDIAAQVPTDVI